MYFPSPRRSKTRIAISASTLQMLIYTGLVSAGLAMLIPWQSLSANGIALLGVGSLIGAMMAWLAIQQRQLRARVRTLEHHLHQISTNKQQQSLQAQSLPHMDPEQFFGKGQTRH